jgi:hypothetical protein
VATSQRESLQHDECNTVFGFIFGSILSTKSFMSKALPLTIAVPRGT